MLKLPNVVLTWPNAFNFSTQHLQHCWAQHVAFVCPLLRCIATCWMMLDQIWKRSNFASKILDVVWCCTRLTTFTRHCWTRACALVALGSCHGHVNIHNLCCVENVENVACVWLAIPTHVATSCNKRELKVHLTPKKCFSLKWIHLPFKLILRKKI